MSTRTPNFCDQCGAALVDRFVDVEQRLRRVCVRCNEISYRNPRILVSTIVACDDRVVLCKRAQPPEEGRWVLPGGFVECDETLEQAAARETWEETGARLDPRQMRLYAVATLPEISEVYVGFLATVAVHTPLTCGSECVETRFFNEADLPWNELAYPDIGVYLRVYFGERRSGEHVIHCGYLGATSVDSKTYRIAEVADAHRPRSIPGAKHD